MLCQNKKDEQIENKEAGWSRRLLSQESVDVLGGNPEAPGNQRIIHLLLCSLILVDLGVPAFLQFLVVRGFALNLAEFHFQPLACTQNFALQVEAAALFGVVGIKQFLESGHDVFEIVFAGGRGLDVQNFAGFIDGYARGTGGLAGCLLLASVFAGRLGLFVGFGEGAAEDPGSGHDDLRDDTMSLGDY